MKTSHPIQKTRLLASAPKWAFAVALAVTSIFNPATSAVAQTVIMRSEPTRITIPKGFSATNTAAVTVVVSGLVTPGVDTVNLAITAIPSLPSGVGFTLSTNSFTNNGTMTATLTVTNDTTVSQGTFNVAVSATGAASYRLPLPIICAYTWGGTNFLNATSTNWTSGGNWLGGVAPSTTTDDVVIRDSGGVSAAAGATNIIISADTEIASLRFAQQTSATRSHNIELQSGATLKVTGAGGISLLKDPKNNTQAIDVKLAGNGRLVVSNAVANVANLINEQSLATLDMRNLNSFEAYVVRLGFGDYRLYPNFYTNGYSGAGSGGAASPGRFYSANFLARTNYIKASGVDANGYSDPAVRDYTLTLGHNEGQSTGSGQTCRLGLGFSNVFYLDSLCIGQGSVANNTPSGGFGFTAAGSYALFRSYAGGRMAVWAIGDGAGQGFNGGATRGIADLSLGTVDVLVDKLYLGRDRTNTPVAQNQTVQGTLTIALGNFDVNTAYVGMQEQGNQQGTGTTAGPEGTLNVNTSAVFRVNETLHLGYTTAANTVAPNSPQQSFGKLNIGSGTVAVSNIIVGGVTKLSTNNSITMGSGVGGKLFVTNAIGDAAGRLTILTATNASQITLYGVKVGETNVFTKSLNMPGGSLGSVTINIPVIGGSPTYPVTIPVIAYDQPAAPSIAGLVIGSLPSGVRAQTTVDNGANKTIDVTFATGAPNLLAWRGNVNNIWDTSTKNWITVPGGVSTNFIDGDSVIFDDNATGSTSIAVSGTVIPGQAAATYGLAMTNVSKNYTFTGGTISGAATLLKAGSGSLTVNSSMSPTVTVVGGSLAGNGSVGAVVLSSGTTMTSFSGSVSGSLDVSNATVTVSGSVANGLIVRAGTLLNNGTISGTVSFSDGATINNNFGATLNANVPWSVPTNSILVNNGTIAQFGPVNGNQGLTVRGTLKGVGKITQQGGSQLSSDVRVTLEAGSQIMIGNTANEITNMTIAVRLDFNAGSQTTFDVNNTGPVNDQINLNDGFIQGKVNFGAGNSQGGSLVINKTAGPSFGISTVLNLFTLTGTFVPDNANQAIPAVSPVPALGLSWDVYNMTTNLTLAVITPPSVTNVISSGSIEFSWPETLRGWRLERQINPITVGLESPSTNWVTLVSSLGGSNPPSMYYPDTNNLSLRYFRSIQTVATTNDTVFYRLTYP